MMDIKDVLLQWSISASSSGIKNENIFNNESA